MRRSHFVRGGIAPYLFVLASGCASEIGEFDEEVCAYAEEALTDLAPTDADFIAFRERSDFDDGTIRTLSQWRTPCTKAEEEAHCLAALSALPIEPALVETNGQTSSLFDVVFTRGGEVRRVATKTELLALLGDIDTPNEAVLVAHASGNSPICGEPNVRKEGTSYILLGGDGGCDVDTTRFEITVTRDGTVSVGESETIKEGDSNCAIGRRPISLRTRGPRMRSVGSFFANAAHLEAASVPAFEHLAKELATHAAPVGLVRRALRSAEDEVRHARVVSALARRYGAVAPRAVVAPMRVRPLVEVAIDNAGEGCVRETFGAVVATYQSLRARDPVVRRALAVIARDEARHAALAWSVDRWARERLSAGERARVATARRAAMDLLDREISTVLPAEIHAYAGMPGPKANAEMWKRLSNEIAAARA